MTLTWYRTPRQLHGHGCSSSPQAARCKWGRGAAIGLLWVVSHQILPVPTALLLFHHLGLYKSWGQENIAKQPKTSSSINHEYFRYSNPHITHIIETSHNHLNVREPVEKSAHTWSISALEPMERMWMRPSSTILVAAWGRPSWETAVGALLSSSRLWQKTKLNGQS